MTNQIAHSHEALKPESRALALNVAHDVLGKIERAAKAIEESERSIKEVKDRSRLKQFFSSSANDLVVISSQQNRINGFLLDLIDEAINLNVMSYSVLAVMIEEVRRGAMDGYESSDGHLRRLSATGKDMAEKATRMFNKILDGSKSTQDAIRVTQEGLKTLRADLGQKSETDAAQWKQIGQLSGSLTALESSLNEKDALDRAQSRQLAELDRALGSEQSTNLAQQETLQALSETLSHVQQDIQGQNVELTRTVQELDERIARLEDVRRPSIWLHTGLAAGIGAAIAYGLTLLTGGA